MGALVGATASLVVPYLFVQEHPQYTGGDYTAFFPVCIPPGLALGALFTYFFALRATGDGVLPDRRQAIIGLLAGMIAAAVLLVSLTSLVLAILHP